MKPRVAGRSGAGAHCGVAGARGHCIYHEPDLAHYSTELMPAFLLAAAVYAAVRQSRAPAPRWLWLTAVLLGCMPWAKLQAAPFAGVVASSWPCRNAAPAGQRSLLTLAAAGCCPRWFASRRRARGPDRTSRFALSHPEPGTYMGAPHFSWREVAAGQWQNALSDGYLGFWFAGALACTVPLALCPRAPRPRRNATGRTGGGRCCLRRPVQHPRPAPAVHASPATHPVPLLWLSGTALALAWPRETKPRTARRRLVLAGCFPRLRPRPATRVAGCGASIRTPGSMPRISVPRAASSRRSVRTFPSGGEPARDLGLALFALRGGRPTAGHATGAVRVATRRRAHQAYFLRRYLEDFQTANPPVSPTRWGRATSPSTPAIAHTRPSRRCANWVRTRYTQVADLDGTRLYVSNDRPRGRRSPGGRTLITMLLQLITCALLFFGLSFGLAWPLVARLKLEPAEKLVASVVCSLLATYLLSFGNLPAGPARRGLLVAAGACGRGTVRGPEKPARHAARRRRPARCSPGRCSVTGWCTGCCASSLITPVVDGPALVRALGPRRFFSSTGRRDTQFPHALSPAGAAAAGESRDGRACSPSRRGPSRTINCSARCSTASPFLPAALLVRRFQLRRPRGGPAGTLLAIAVFTVFVMLNPAFVENATFAWTKLITVCFILGGLYFYLRSLDPDAPRAAGPLCACALAAALLAQYSAGPLHPAAALAWPLMNRARWGDGLFLAPDGADGARRRAW